MSDHSDNGNSGNPLITTFKSGETKRNFGVIYQNLVGKSNRYGRGSLSNKFCGHRETWPLSKE